MNCNNDGLLWKFRSVLFAGLWLSGLGLGVSEESARWPQFRGPTGQGLALEAAPPQEWDETKNIRWKTDIPGLGHSSPVIWDDQIWLTTSTLDGKELSLVGLDRKEGRILHQVVLFRRDPAEEIHSKNSHASPTPVVTEGHVYAHFGTNGTAAVDYRDGTILWKNEELKIDHNTGPGSSPVLWKDLLIVTCDGADQQFVAALECETGKVRWKRNRSAPYRSEPLTHRAFATPLLIEHEGKPQLISPAADQLHAYDPDTGDELWHVRFTGFSTVPCPAYANGMIFMSTGYFGPEIAAIKVDGTGNVTDSNVVWHVKKGAPDTPSPLTHEGRVYIVSDKGVASCLDAETGKQLWSRRLGGNFSASPILAGGHIYFCNEQGETHVLKPESTPKPARVSRLPGHILASPAVIGRTLYLRTHESLYCIEETL